MWRRCSTSFRPTRSATSTRRISATIRSASSAPSTCAMRGRATRSRSPVTLDLESRRAAPQIRRQPQADVRPHRARGAGRDRVVSPARRGARAAGEAADVSQPRTFAQGRAARDAQSRGSAASRSIVPSISAIGSTSASVFDGPAIVDQLDATTVIPPGQSARVDEFKNILITARPRLMACEPLGAIDIEIIKASPLRHRAGDAELAVPHRLLHHRARIPGRLLRHHGRARRCDRAACRAAAAHGRVSRPAAAR